MTTILIDHPDYAERFIDDADLHDWIQAGWFAVTGDGDRPPADPVVRLSQLRETSAAVEVLRRRTSEMMHAFRFGAARGLPGVWAPGPGDGAVSADIGATPPAGGQFWDVAADDAPYRPTNGVYTGDDGSGVNWNAPWHLGSDVAMDVEGVGCYVYVSVADPNMMYQWVIDGRTLTSRPVKYGVTGGTIITLTFTDTTEAARRNVVFRSGGALVDYVGKLATGQNTQMFKPQKHRHFAMIGNSLCSGAQSDQTTMGNAIPDMIGLLTGTPVYNASAGGTGYCANNSNSPVGPYGSDIRQNGLSTLPGPIDGIVVWGGANDVSWIINDPANHTAAMVGTAARALFADLAARFPGTPVVVMGVEPSPLLSEGSAATVAAEVQVELAAAAAAAPNVVSFVDGLTDPWVDPSLEEFYVMADTIHWNPEATRTLTQRFMSEAFHD